MKKHIEFKDFICGLNLLCRSPDDELDHYIFKIFNMRNDKKVHRDEITMMAINLPDMNFGLTKNIKNYFTR